MTVVGNRLSDMEFDEVSLVNRPANQLSKVVLFKSDEEPKMPGHYGKKRKMMDEEEEVSKPGHYGKMKMMDEDEDEEEVSKPGHKMKMKDEVSKPGHKMKDDEDEETMKERMARLRAMQKSDEAIDLPGEVYDYIEALESANAEMVDELSKMAEFVEGEDELLKSADPAIVEIVKAAEERAEAAEQIAKAERDFRLEREFIAKAAEFDRLPVDAAEFGPVLKAAAEVLTEEQFDAITSVLAAANESVAQGNLFTEVGKATSFANDSSMSQIEKAAARLREGSDMTRAESIAKAVEADPSLYTEYLRGN